MIPIEIHSRETLGGFVFFAKHKDSTYSMAKFSDLVKWLWEMGFAPVTILKRGE